MVGYGEYKINKDYYNIIIIQRKNSLSEISKILGKDKSTVIENLRTRKFTQDMYIDEENGIVVIPGVIEASTYNKDVKKVVCDACGATNALSDGDFICEYCGSALK